MPCGYSLRQQSWRALSCAVESRLSFCYKPQSAMDVASATPAFMNAPACKESLQAMPVELPDVQPLPDVGRSTAQLARAQQTQHQQHQEHEVKEGKETEPELWGSPPEDTALVLLRVPSCAPQQSPLELLLSGIRTALASERCRGNVLGPDCPGSYQRVGPQIEGLLSAYAKSAKDWQKYTFFNPLHYVRNLIDGDDDFELMVLCWAPGQRSRIHNHGRSHCWLTVLQGEVEEARYTVCQGKAAEGEVAVPVASSDPAVLHCSTPCPGLDLDLVHRVTPGQVAYVNDTLFLHSVGCAEGVAAPGAITLHLYSPPIKRATLYEPQENRVVVRTPGFYSVKGVRT